MNHDDTHAITNDHDHAPLDYDAKYSGYHVHDGAGVVVYVDPYPSDDRDYVQEHVD